ncbi:MAG: pseudouridine synthase [Candidatus Falkowbacteria bacterium]
MEIIYPIIINKYVAQKNIASRKEADRLLKAGKIMVNGKLAEPGQMIAATDDVWVDYDKVLYYVAYNKPRGVVTSCGQGSERNIVDVLKLPAGVVPIGRLDKDSEGLIILTNDGRVTDRLLNPDRYHEKEYLVSVDREIVAPQLQQLAAGVKLDDGYITRTAKVKRIDSKRFTIVLTEGKNRQIRRMVETVGLKVKQLKRVRIMNIKLDRLTVGQTRPLTKEEIADFFTD